MSSPYDNFAKYYDGWFLSPFVKSLHKQAIKFVAPYIKNNSSVLDVGCGTGAFLKQLAKRNKNLNLKVFGIDASSGMIKRALKKKIPQANFQTAPAEDIPFPNDNFDLIACVDSFYYFNQPEFLANCHNCLKQDGYFFLNTLSIDHRKILTYPLVWFAKLFRIGQNTKHLKFQEIETMAIKKGFKVIKAEAKSFPISGFFKNWLIIFQRM
ncbi:MAG: class I SAM-dependent methyltransferase [bacterium]